MLRKTAHTSTWPFKGRGSYWTLGLGGRVHENVAWSYEERIPGAEGIAGLIAFYDDQVEVVVEPLPAESSSE